MPKVVKKHFAYKYDINADKRTDWEGFTHKQWLDRAKRERPEWYERMKVRLENPDVWDEYLRLN